MYAATPSLYQQQVPQIYQQQAMYYYPRQENILHINNKVKWSVKNPNTTISIIIKTTCPSIVNTNMNMKVNTKCFAVLETKANSTRDITRARQDQVELTKHLSHQTSIEVKNPSPTQSLSKPWIQCIPTQLSQSFKMTSSLNSLREPWQSTQNLSRFLHVFRIEMITSPT